VRRALRVGETDVAPRVSDLAALAASTSGKIEIESMEEGRESQILQNFVKAAVLQVFKKRVSSAKIGEVIALFEGGVIAHAGEDIASAQYVELFNQVPPLRELVVAAVGNTDSVAQIASGVEFVLEGLHLSKRLNKDESGSRATYRSRT
jgi:magnesium chelatase subunit I